MHTTIVNRTKSLFGLSISLFTASVVMEETIWAFRPADTMNTIAYVLRVMRYIAYALALLCFFLKQRHTSKVLIYLSVIAMIIMLSMFGSRNKTIFLYIPLFIAALGVNSDYLIKHTFATQTLIWSTAILSSLLGFTKDYYWIQGNRIRHSLGFTYTVAGPNLYFYMLLQYLFLKKGKLLFREYILFMPVAIFFYYATKTRTIFIITVCTLTFFLFYKKFLGRGFIIKGIRYLVIFSPFIAFAISLWVALSYDSSNRLWQTFNVLMSDRLSLSQKGIISYGITLFGQPIDWIGTGMQSLLYGYRGTYNYVDNSYLRILFEYGIVLLFVVLCVYAIILRNAIQDGAFYMVWIILLILAHALVEPYLIRLATNPFLLVLVAHRKNTAPENGNYLYEKRKT